MGQDSKLLKRETIVGSYQMRALLDSREHTRPTVPSGRPSGSSMGSLKFILEAHESI